MQKLPPEEKTFLPCFSEKQDETQPSERKLQQISNQLLQITSPKIEKEKKFGEPWLLHMSYRISTPGSGSQEVHANSYFYILKF
jgi:hypothetical protein